MSNAGHNHRPLPRYVAALVATLLALLLRLALGELVRDTSVFLFFVPAVMFSAWHGGLGPGLLATLAGAAVGDYFLVDPPGAFSHDRENLPRVLVFILVGAQVSWLGGALRSAKLRAEADAEAARRGERLYRTLASNFPNGFVCLFDRELKWTLAEGAGLGAAGLSRAALEGRPVADSLPPEMAARVLPMCRAAVGGEAVAGEVRHGQRVYFVQALPLGVEAPSTGTAPADATTSTSSPAGAASPTTSSSPASASAASAPAAGYAGMVILQDITDRARARDALQSAHDQLERRVAERTAELHFQKTLLESQSEASLDGILAVDNDGRVIFANRRFYDAWGLGPDDRGAPLEALRRAMASRLVEPQRDPLAPDGERQGRADSDGLLELLLSEGRTLERFSAPILSAAGDGAAADGTGYGRVWFFRDITERKRLQREIIEAGERERQRIGQDLHDDLCQQLTGIACMGRVLQQRLASRQAQGSVDATAAPAAAPVESNGGAYAGIHAGNAHAGDGVEEAAQIVQLVQQAAGRARDLAKGLQPVKLQRDGLVAALNDLCASASKMYGIACRFRGADGGGREAGAADATAPRLDDPAAATHLYRIVQEAINNAVRHGRARNVSVDLLAVGGRVILTVEDDGVGIPDVLPQRGLGLETMSYRARMIGGSLTVERGHERGTVVTCSLRAAERTAPAGAADKTGPAAPGATAAPAAAGGRAVDDLGDERQEASYARRN